MVADTGSWLSGSLVLLSPHAFSSLDATGKVLRVNLTRKLIEDSPLIESHKPVSRQYEEEYHRYYGWPYYWQGDALWGMSGFPILQLPAMPLANESAGDYRLPLERTDAHLRSTQAVGGYHLQASDGVIGHVCDFMMDAQSWAIRQLIVKTGHRFSGKEVQIPTRNVERISYPGLHRVRKPGAASHRTGSPAAPGANRCGRLTPQSVRCLPRLPGRLKPWRPAGVNTPWNTKARAAYSPFMKHNNFSKTQNRPAPRGQRGLRTSLKPRSISCRRRTKWPEGRTSLT